MRQIRVILFTALMIIAAGCTHNNGDIGPWFGIWYLERMDIDGVDDPDYGSDVILKFQGSVLETQVIDPYAYNFGRFASWSCDGNVLIINAAPDVTDVKGLVSRLKLPEEDGLRLDVLSQTGKNATLRWVSPSGQTQTYFLRKHL